MNSNVEICPRCQNYVEGKKEITTGRIVARKASNSALKWICMFILGFVGFFFGGIGAIPGAILGYIIGVLITSSANDVGDDLYESLNMGYDLNFTCPKCGNSWTKRVNEDGEIDAMPPVTIIEEQQKSYLKANGVKFASYLKTVILSALTIFTFYHCWVDEFKYQRWQEETWLTKAHYVTDYHLEWLLWAIAFIILLKWSINSISSLIDKHKRIKQVSALSPEEFYNSFRELFGRR